MAEEVVQTRIIIVEPQYAYFTRLDGDSVKEMREFSRRGGPVVLVWDHAPIHRRQAVQAFLTQHPRLHIYDFPTYAPELNPVEFVWTQTHEYLAGRAPLWIGELLPTLQQALARLRRSPLRLSTCVYGSDLPWQRPVGAK